VCKLAHGSCANSPSSRVVSSIPAQSKLYASKKSVIRSNKKDCSTSMDEWDGLWKTIPTSVTEECFTPPGSPKSSYYTIYNDSNKK
jgi:hypothetical protein